MRNRSPLRKTAWITRTGPWDRQNTDLISHFFAVEDLARGLKGQESLGTVTLDQIREVKSHLGKPRGHG